MANDRIHLVKDTDDIESLWENTGYRDPLTSTALTRIKVGKPKGKTYFFRVVPDEAYRRPCRVYSHRPQGDFGDDQIFLISPEMYEHLDVDAEPVLLVTMIDRLGCIQLWPLRTPKDGERDNDWWVSARQIAQLAMTRWVRVVSKTGYYEAIEADPAYAPEPDWSKLPPFNDLVRAGFGTQSIIRDANHPIVRELFGKPLNPAGSGGSGAGGIG